MRPGTIGAVVSATHDCAEAVEYAKIPMPGGVGEWLKPPDCKSGVRKGFAGSNPAPSTNQADTGKSAGLTGLSQGLESGRIIDQIIPVKSPVSSAVEHVLGKNGVGGSIPPLGSSKNRPGYKGPEYE